jgi:hypothetical protein
MVKRELIIVIVCVLFVGCSPKDQGSDAMDERKAFHCADFNLLIPEGWEFLEEESQPDRVVFQATNTSSRLTISIMYATKPLSDDEAASTLERVVMHRRRAESEVNPAPNLTDYTLFKEDDFIYSPVGWATRLPMRSDKF